MVTEMISMKLEDSFLKAIDTLVKKEGYQSRTEFIRTALREKVEAYRLKRDLMEISRLRGASKKKTTAKEYERIREKAFEEIDKKIR